MRYLLTCLAIVVAWSQPANVGGDGCGYRWYTHLAGVVDSTPTYSWIDPTSLTNPQQVSGLGDDNFVGPISLPFAFAYYWNTYTKIYVGSNGYITFGRGFTVASGAAPYFNSFPNSASPNEWIGVYVADLTFTDDAGNPVPGAKLIYGTDAQGRFVITWDSVPYWTDEVPSHWRGRNSFQLILDPSDSSITLQYKYIDTGYDGTYASGNFNVVGMENITGQSGLNIAAAWPVPFQDYAIKIWHPGTFSCIATDVQADWSLTERGEGILVLKNGVPPALQAGVLNAGNQDITTQQVRSILRIQGPGGSATTIYSDTVFIQPPFSAGAAFIATYTKPFSTNQSTPTNLTTGSYRANHIVTLMGGGDGFAGNNQYQAELVVCDSATSGTNRGRYLLRYDDGSWDPNTDDLGGASFANGMTFVAPQDLVVEALSVDMIYEESGANNYPLSLWVYAYDPASGSVGTLLDSVGIDVLDFANGDSLNAFVGQNNAIFKLRRYTVPLTQPISLSAGQGLAVGFLTQAPPSATSIGNTVVGDASLPISRRALEGIAGIWAPYRDAESVDYAVGLVARLPQTTTTPTATTQPTWDFTLFPNPAYEPPILRFTLPKAGPVALRIVDITGRTVWKSILTVPTGGYKMSLPITLPSGTYFVGATYESFTKGVRLVIP
ncbi:MAG: hypothetical protein KatS3mg025_1152 [Bacteroidia bacterium]|nr:MAG: hypothetical protein KatS3mg025_1152 [Bacteroidia bacterium]